MTIVAVLEIRVRKDALDRAPAEIEGILTKTRAFEGSLGVDVLQDVQDPSHMTIIEYWASVERADAYVEWRATPDGESTLIDLVDAPFVLTRFERTLNL